MELVRNQSFTLTTSDSKQSRLRRLKNGVPQGSVLASILFNIYTYNLPSMISRKFACADDLALLHSSGNWNHEIGGSDGIQNFKNRFSFVSNSLIRVFSKKKKGLHFDFISNFPIFLPKLGCSLKKKKKSLHSESFFTL